jgi:hypothetical protein
MSILTDLLATTGDRDDDGQDLHLPEWIKGNSELIALYRNADLPTVAHFWQAQRDEPGKAQVRNLLRREARHEED